MGRRIVVGTEGGPGGDSALALARALAGPEDTVLLVHAYPYSPSGRPSVTHHGEALEGRALEWLAEQADAAAARTGTAEGAAPPAPGRAVAAPAIAVEAVADLSPARALHEVAEREEAALIVVGSCHRGSVGRVLLGDVSRGVLHGSPCPVAVAPLGLVRPAAAPRTIGVGFDGRDPSRRAVAFAADLAARSGAALRVIAVVTPPAAFAPAYAYSFNWPDLVDELRDEARRDVDELLASLGGVQATGDVLVGTAGEALAEESAALDLLVTGSRGYGAAKRVLLGSTADRVIHRARCPVVVVP